MNNLALINICSIRHKSSAMGAEFFESHSTLEGADFTVRTPASPSVTAALRLGDRVPVARADLTHVLEHLGEAVPFPVVLGEKEREGKAGNCSKGEKMSSRHSSWAGLAVNPSLHSQV